MKEQTIEKWLSELSKIDELHLNIELNEAVQKQAEVLNSIFELNDKLITATSKYKTLKRVKMIKYITSNTGDDMIDQLSLRKEQLEELLASDPDLLDSKERIEKINNLLDLHNKALDLLKQKNYNMKSILDYQKFMAGD